MTYRKPGDILAIAAEENRDAGDYWLGKLSGELNRAGFPYDFKKSKKEVEMDRVSFDFADEVFAGLKKLSRESDYALNVILIAGLTLLLDRFTGSGDIIVGAPIYKQDRPGDFINTVLALRNRVEEEKSFKELLLQVRQTVSEAEKNQNYPLESILDRLDIAETGAGGGFPLFDVVILLENIHDRDYVRHIETGMVFSFLRTEDRIEGTLEFDTLSYDRSTIERIITAFKHILQRVLADPDINLSEVETMTEEEKERILFDFNDTATSYPVRQTIQALFQEQVERNPQGIALTGPATGRAGDRDTGSAVEEQVSLTYGQLSHETGELAGLLIRKGAGAGSIAGLMVERSIEMIIGILAILQAGGAYLPIDPAYPEPRKRYMLVDSSAGLLLTTRDFEQDIEKLKVSKLNFETIFIEAGIRVEPGARHSVPVSTVETQHLASQGRGGPPVPPNKPKPVGGAYMRPETCYLPPAPATSLAYIMYTSGSAGNSKGVMVEHRSVTRLVMNTNYVELNDKTRILLTGAPVFDATTFEIWGALLNGGILFLVENDVILNAGRLGSVLSKNKINTMWLTSPLFNQLMQQDDNIFCQLRNLLVGGDVLSPRYIEKVRSKNKKLKVINGYGPTENTTFSTTYLIDKDFRESIPIGKPIANSTAYILDRNGKLQLPGVPGELVVGGDGVARGYLNNPELTAERFIASGGQGPGFPSLGGVAPTNHCGRLGCTRPKGAFLRWWPRSGGVGLVPTANFQLLYHTGDLAKWLPDGNIDFLGRMDNQVKIRGFRIELGEIKSRLLKHEDIKEAAVTINEGSDQKYLCAYIVGDIAETSPLRQYLAERVPGYMIPSYFTILDEMPLTPNGKIDWRRLPEPEKTTAEGYVAPRDEIERKLVKIWSLLFGVKKEKIGIDDDFFELGGHSLKATKLVYFIHKEFEIDMELKQVFVTPGIRELAQIIKAAETKEYTAIAAVEEKEYYEMSYAQRRLWILCRFEEESTAYNMPGAIVFSGIFDAAAFKEAVQVLADRHESLRTVFISAAGHPYQRVLKGFKFNLEQIDLREFEEKIKEEKAREIYLEDAGRAFDLQLGPLFRFKTVRLEEEKTLLIHNFHHIIIDGWSQGNIYNEIITLYNAFRAGQDNPCPLPEIQYKDYTLWHNNLIAAGHFDASREYWVEKFKDKPNGIELPIDHLRKPLQTFNGGRISFSIGEEKTARLSRLSVEEDVTFFMTLLALVTIFLHKYSGQEDILTGSPIANRRKPELHPIVGFFVNTLVFRNRVSPGLTFEQYLDEIKRETLECYEYQDYPFDLLVEQLGLDRDLSQSPLFNFMLAHNNAETEDSDMAMAGLTSLPFAYAEDFNMSKFDLMINMNEFADCIYPSIEYNSDLFDRGTIERMAANFLVLIDSVLAGPGIPISRLNVISQSESEDLLHRFNDTATAYPKDRTIPELFHEQVGRNPHSIALNGPAAESAGDRDTGSTMKERVSLTYSRLSREIDDLAGLLIRKGVGAGTIVGLLAERSVQMITAIFAILKAGGAYLPMEPQSPAVRKRYMLKDSSAGLLLITRDFEQEVEKLAVNMIETIFIEASASGGQGSLLKNRPKTGENAVRSSKCHTLISAKFPHKTSDEGQERRGEPCVPKHMRSETEGEIPSPGSGGAAPRMAYIIYTSGSTGKPKGVLVEHSAVVNLAFYQRKEFNITGRERILQFSSYCFDASVEQIFIALFSGAVLVLIDKDTLLHGDRFAKFISKQAITHIHAVPSFLSNINLSPGHEVKRIIAGGDICPVSLAKRLSGYCEFYNEYGPTETTVTSIELKVEEVDESLPRLPIGKPIGNTFLLVLDKALRPVPTGVRGELYIGGDGVARGYLNNPELTAEKFPSGGQGPGFPSLGGVAHINHGGRLGCTRPKGAFLRWWPRSGGVGLVPTANFQLIYKTGDLAKWLPDGNIEFIGRMDNQVKIRGFRIELGEIESRLSAIPGVEEASVLAKEYKSGDRYLCAYIVAKSDDTLDAVVVRAHLSQSLPGYMVPSHFTFLDRMPLTANGKIDRKALPETEVRVGGVYEAPRDDVEKRMTAIWSDVLGSAQEKIGIDDNFFELGGHSLKVMEMTARLQEELGLKIPIAGFFTAPTIRELTGSMPAAEKEQVSSIEPVEKKEYYPLSSAQKRFYILQYMEKENTSYNIQSVCSLRGEIEPDSLERAFAALIERHEPLRTAFRLINGNVVQIILDKVKFQTGYYHSLSGSHQLPGNEEDREPVSQILEDFVRPFDLSRPPLIRGGLIKTGEDEYILAVDMSHIIADGTSLDILVNEFTRLYGSGGEEKLAPLRLRFKDIVEWMNREEHSAAFKQQENWWLEQFPPSLVDDLPRLNLPLDYERSPIQTSAGSTMTFTIGREETAAIKKLALEENVTLFIVILTLCNLLLAKICHQEDIIVGSPVINRGHTSLLSIVGNFLNTLALRNYPRRGVTFRQFLKDVGARTFRAFQNRDYPYEELVDRLLTRRDSSRHSLFDVLVVLKNTERPATAAKPTPPLRGTPPLEGTSREHSDKSDSTFPSWEGMRPQITVGDWGVRNQKERSSVDGMRSGRSGLDSSHENKISTNSSTEADQDQSLIPGMGDSSIKIRPYAHDFNRSPFDMGFFVAESGGKIDFSFYYKTTLFRRETISRMIGNFKEILAAVLTDKDIRLGDIVISGDVLLAAANREEEGLGDFGF